MKTPILFLLAVLTFSNHSLASFASKERRECLSKEIAVENFDKWNEEFARAVEETADRPAFHFRVLKAAHKELVAQVLRIEEDNDVVVDEELMLKSFRLQQRLERAPVDIPAATALLFKQTIALRKEVSKVLKTIQEESPQCRFNPNSKVLSSGNGSRSGMR